MPKITLMTPRQEAYAKAFDIDRQIQNLLDCKGITKENAHFWLTYCRTITTSLNIIKTIAKKALLLDGENHDHPRPR